MGFGHLNFSFSPWSIFHLIVIYLIIFRNFYCQVDSQASAFVISCSIAHYPKTQCLEETNISSLLVSGVEESECCLPGCLWLWVCHRAAGEPKARAAVSSGDLTGEDWLPWAHMCCSRMHFLGGVGWRPQFLACGPLHRAAHSMAAASLIGS